MTGITEKLLEDEITAGLVKNGGYRAMKIGNSAEHKADFDPKLGLDTVELFAFVEETQPESWAKLVKAHGGVEASARQKFLERLTKELDERSTLDVIRHGVVDQGVTVRLSYRRPAFGVAPELVAHYDANRLTVTRQFPYDSGSSKTVDLCLLVNGIPVATAELKNHLTGQNIEHAIGQYRKDRDPKNVTLAGRCLVHFAVDPDAVAMTTRLAGEKTFFLPFNLGHELGKGNPPNPRGHKTSYLWERVWQRDAWLDLIHRFIDVQRPKKGTAAQKLERQRVIFPRYHQWDAVLKLEADAKANGAGRSYLIQHSAGSGKSNTIAWTAHRLSTLHDDQDRKVFDKVVVITDRVVLDRQLQDTIYQFEHAHGVVQKIDKNSKQLAEALAGEQARIIVTTLWKFPVIAKTASALPNRTYAVIIDEAHSSQTGEAAKGLKVVLGGTDEQELTAAEAEDAGLLVNALDPVEEALGPVASPENKPANLSFFAFTATPKGKTLETFGSYDPAEDRFKPFHLYSMRQAIQEGFIMDVLGNYSTYHTYWKIEKASAEDQEYDTKQARRAIARFVSLHPTQLGQKAEIIIEHFRTRTRLEMGGQAKAMLVCSSRLHAARYKQAIERYVAERGYDDVKALVAFSGSLEDNGVTLTEQSMNQLPESETAARFAEPEYGLLIVAEKFQTGFDQPLLQTMYVDKTLLGITAVQTLSRLNRMHPLKDRTFVLDFRNETDTIVEAFEQFHGVTVAPPTDVNVLWDARAKLDQSGVLAEDEIAVVVALLENTSSGPTGKLSAEVYAALGPARERFDALGEDEQGEFRADLVRFVRAYSFISQIAPFVEPAIARDSVYCRALALYLRDASTAERLDLGSEVELTHLRNQLTSEGALALEAETGEVATFFGTGSGGQQELELETLSSIVAQLNDKFGTDFSDADKLLFDQFEAEWVADDELSDQAQANSIENFGLAFDKKFMSTIVGRMDQNSEIFKRVLDDDDFSEFLKRFYVNKIYEELRGSG